MTDEDGATEQLRTQIVAQRLDNAGQNERAVSHDDFLRSIPKTDLHVHLDGSLRIKTLIELAKESGVELPSTDEEELRRTVFKDQYANLVEYLEGFKYTTAVMQNARSVERVAYEFAEDNYLEGVRYFEVRFAPQLHASASEADEFGIRSVIGAVDRGLRRARDEFNARLLAEQATRSSEPFYDYGIIACAMRMFFAGMSRYYAAFVAVHADESPERIASLASMSLVEAAVLARDVDGARLVAVDIAGAERGHQASVHMDAFKLAHSHLLGKTVHAGEAYGPESIMQAIRDLHAQRIGHGFHLFHADLVEGERQKGSDGGHNYVRQLVKYVSDNRICFEVCPTSNLNTMPGLKLCDHAINQMLRHNVCVTINTDNRLVSSTTTVEELKKTIVTFNLNSKQLKDLVINGFKRSFYPGPYEERRAYVRKVMNFYDEVKARYE